MTVHTADSRYSQLGVKQRTAAEMPAHGCNCRPSRQSWRQRVDPAHGHPRQFFFVLGALLAMCRSRLMVWGWWTAYPDTKFGARRHRRRETSFLGPSRCSRSAAYTFAGIAATFFIDPKPVGQPLPANSSAKGIWPAALRTVVDPNHPRENVRGEKGSETQTGASETRVRQRRGFLLLDNAAAKFFFGATRNRTASRRPGSDDFVRG